MNYGQYGGGNSYGGANAGYRGDMGQGYGNQMQQGYSPGQQGQGYGGMSYNNGSAGGQQSGQGQPGYYTQQQGGQNWSAATSQNMSNYNSGQTMQQNWGGQVSGMTGQGMGQGMGQGTGNIGSQPMGGAGGSLQQQGWGSTPATNNLSASVPNVSHQQSKVLGRNSSAVTVNMRGEAISRPTSSTAVRPTPVSSSATLEGMMGKLLGDPSTFRLTKEERPAQLPQKEQTMPSQTGQQMPTGHFTPQQQQQIQWQQNQWQPNTGGEWQTSSSGGAGQWQSSNVFAGANGGQWGQPQVSAGSQAQAQGQSGGDWTDFDNTHGESASGEGWGDFSGGGGAEQAPLSKKVVEVPKPVSEEERLARIRALFSSAAAIEEEKEEKLVDGGSGSEQEGSGVHTDRQQEAQWGNADSTSSGSNYNSNGNNPQLQGYQERGPVLPAGEIAGYPSPNTSNISSGGGNGGGFWPEGAPQQSSASTDKENKSEWSGFAEAGGSNGSEEWGDFGDSQSDTSQESFGYPQAAIAQHVSSIAQSNRNVGTGAPLSQFSRDGFDETQSFGYPSPQLSSQNTSARSGTPSTPPPSNSNNNGYPHPASIFTDMAAPPRSSPSDIRSSPGAIVVATPKAAPVPASTPNSLSEEDRLARIRALFSSPAAVETGTTSSTSHEESSLQLPSGSAAAAAAKAVVSGDEEEWSHFGDEEKGDAPSISTPTTSHISASVPTSLHEPPMKAEWSGFGDETNGHSNQPPSQSTVKNMYFSNPQQQQPKPKSLADMTDLSSLFSTPKDASPAPVVHSPGALSYRPPSKQVQLWLTVVTGAASPPRVGQRRRRRSGAHLKTPLSSTPLTLPPLKQMVHLKGIWSQSPAIAGRAGGLVTILPHPQIRRMWHLSSEEPLYYPSPLLSQRALALGQKKAHLSRGHSLCND